jgi:hypothetical protein
MLDSIRRTIVSTIEVDLLMLRAKNFTSARRHRTQQIEPTRRDAVRMRVYGPDTEVVHRSRRHAGPTSASCCASV